MTDIAWHFTGDKLRDGSPIPAIGETLIYPGEIVMCESGYHWSRTPFQALQYAPGHLLHKVRIGGKIEEEEDKGVSSERTILATIDATRLLRRFAVDQAIAVAHLWPMPDVVREYLTGLDESKRNAVWSAASNAAWSAARNAAWNAAWSAAESAARNAALSAAESAARSAALSAALSAAESAARSAARNAAWNAARNAALSAAESAAWSAAESAARSAALSAALSAASKDFNARVYAAFEMENV